MAVEKARGNNMPQDNIKRAIARAQRRRRRSRSKRSATKGTVRPGSRSIVDAATDNRNRTAAEMRFLFSRNDGTLGETGQRRLDVRPRGIDRSRPARLTEDELTEKALVDGVIDVRYGSRARSSPSPTALMAVREALEAAGLRVSVGGARDGGQADDSRPAGGETAAILAFLDALEEHEDVQRVY